MLSIKVTSCRDCQLISKLLGAINCQLAKMANNLYLNMAYMLDRPVEACKMSTLLHYKRILTYKANNEDWGDEEYTIEEIANQVRVLTANCECCDDIASGMEPTTTTTTTTTV